GAEDNHYTRTIIRKVLVAAVARVFNPGIKFDNMMVLSGPQGMGKSTFIKKLGGDWYSDSLTTVQGKEAYEQLQGVWLLEMGEMMAT
ncbi:VapE domain-containing protein, partial [Clostridioides difficile]